MQSDRSEPRPESRLQVGTLRIETGVQETDILSAFQDSARIPLSQENLEI